MGLPYVAQSDGTSRMRVYVDGAVKRHQLKGERSGYIAVVANSEKIVERVGAVTNNQAEYLALIRAMQMAIDRSEDDLVILSDSLLLVRQLEGKYRVKSENIKSLHAKVQALRSKFLSFAVNWIPREKNLAGKLLE